MLKSMPGAKRKRKHLPKKDVLTYGLVLKRRNPKDFMEIGSMNFQEV
jgi:hypothetical protein